MIPMATKPRENPSHVLSGEAPGGVAEIVFKQFGVLLAIVFLYISLWMILDDSAWLPGTKVQPPKPIAMPHGLLHEVAWDPALKAVRDEEAKKIDSWDAGKIPVDKAMALIAQRGLPTKLMAASQQQVDLATTTTEANGGQIQWMKAQPAEHAAPAAHGAAPAEHATPAAHGAAPAEHAAPAAPH
jgi:hypothetical protein